MGLSNYFASLSAMDLDDLFSYETFKTVVVKDRRLGVLRYFFILIIIVYMGYTIHKDELYLVKDPIIAGTIRTTFRSPPWSGGYRVNCGDPCIFLNERDAAEIRDNSLFLATHVSIRNTTAPCHYDEIPTRSTCIPFFDPATTQKFSVAGIERYTIMIEHSIFSFLTNSGILSKGMKGRLLNDKDEVMRVYLPTTSTEDEIAAAIKESGKEVLELPEPYIPGDIISVGDLLNAAGLGNLDTEVLDASGTNRSIRHEGAILVVMIKYQHKLGNIENMYYDYIVRHVNKTSAKRIHLKYVEEGKIIQEWKSYGLHIQFVQTGFTGKFSLVELFKSIVASWAALGVAQIIVEVLMLRVLKERRRYKKFKFEVVSGFRKEKKQKKQSEQNEQSSIPAQSIPVE